MSATTTGERPKLAAASFGDAAVGSVGEVRPLTPVPPAKFLRETSENRRTDSRTAESSAGSSTAAAKKSAAATVPLVEPQAPRPPRRYESITSMACSLTIHGLIILLLGLIAWDRSEHGLIGLIGEFSQPTEPGADLLIDSQLEIDPGGSPMPIEIASLSEQLEGMNSQLDAFEPRGGIGNGTGGGEGDGSALEAGAPMVNVPARAVTKGSFSAWTEPEDPQPFEPYVIIISVRLPEKIKKYRPRDLSGIVLGTDGYKQLIRFSTSQVVDPEAGVVQFQIQVPGARQLVRDTIRIESKLLKEKQVLQLEF